MTIHNVIATIILREILYQKLAKRQTLWHPWGRFLRSLSRTITWILIKEKLTTTNRSISTFLSKDCNKVHSLVVKKNLCVQSSSNLITTSSRLPPRLSLKFILIYVACCFQWLQSSSFSIRRRYSVSLKLHRRRIQALNLPRFSRSVRTLCSGYMVKCERSHIIQIQKISICVYVLRVSVPLLEHVHVHQPPLSTAASLLGAWDRNWGWTYILRRPLA